MSKSKVIIVSGPTASGKTRTSIELALEIINKFKRPAEIINFDSLLFYKELSIGTAKPTIEERKGIKHHLIDICSAKNPLNAAEYLKMASALIEEKTAKGIVPLLVGGSGFYLRALIKGMYETCEIPEQIKADIQARYQKEGITPFIELLKSHDPVSLQNLHANDHYRLLRACEFFMATGFPISKEKERKAEEAPYDFSKNTFPQCDFHHIYLDLPKEQHGLIIENRIKQMLADGLLNEIRNLLNNGFTGEEKPMQSIGYKESIEFLKKQINTQDELIERITI